jgi:hypothetical protein
MWTKAIVSTDVGIHARAHVQHQRLRHFEMLCDDHDEGLLSESHDHTLIGALLAGSIAPPVGGAR